MPIIKIVPMPGPAGTGGSADTADFVFNTVESPDYESTMTVTNNDMVVKTIVDTEASGNIRIESAQNIVLNANGDAYIGDANSENNRIATIADIQEASTADFIFTDEGGSSSISLPGSKRMTIEAGAESDLYLTAGDDLYIQTLGDGDDIHLNSADDIRFTTRNRDSVFADTPTWRMTSEGLFELPGNGYISNPYAETFTSETYTVGYSDNYLYNQAGLNQAFSVALPVEQSTLWFINNYNITSPVTITFADLTTTTTVAIYDATSQGTPAVIFQWDDQERNKTYEETFPLTVSAQYDQVQYGASTIVLDPEWIGNDQKIVIDATAPNHIHIRAGGEMDASTAELILGAELTNVQVSDSDDSVYVRAFDGEGSRVWQFKGDGSVKLPYNTSNARTGNGEVLKFGDINYQSIITGPPATFEFATANRIVIAGQDGAAGDGYDGEGGDVYLWAGQGGGTAGNGGDIKIDGGNGAANGSGGYVKIRGGDSTTASGGFIEITAGESVAGVGGDVTINAGQSTNGEGTAGGNVNINAGYSSSSWAGGNISLSTTAEGKITLSGAGGEFLNDSSVPGNQIATVSQLPTGVTTTFATGDGRTATVTNGIITGIE